MAYPLARVGFLAAFGAIALAPVFGQDAGPGVLRESFEDGRPTWRQEETDATVNLLDHDRSDRAAHDGRTSERIHFEAGPGSALFFSYALPRIPIADDPDVDLYVRSDHAGLQLFGRVVLPADVDPDTGQPSFVLVPGEMYETAGRWERLSLADLANEVERRARVLRAGSRRPVGLEGAYLEQLVVNLYGGPGETVVYLDDLTVKPVPGAEAGRSPEAPTPPPVEARPANPEVAESPSFEEPRPPASTGEAAGGRIRLDRNRLSREGKPWVPTIIRAPGADPEPLLRYGFDVLAVEADGDPRVALESARSGFLLMPDLDDPDGDESVDGIDGRLEAARTFEARDAVAFWNLGEGLGRPLDPEARDRQRDRIRALISAFRDVPGPFPRLTTGGVEGLFPDYARAPQNLDLIGVHPIGWGTSQDLKETHAYLAQRRTLTAIGNPNATFWTWITATPPDEVHQAVWGYEAPGAEGLARVQPDQVRLYTYAALMAGYRGLGYRSDADLTRGPGRAMLIEMALLNAEIDLIQSIVAEGTDPIRLLPTFMPDPPITMIYTSPGNGGSAINGSGGLQSVEQMQRLRPEAVANPTIHAAAISTQDGRGKLLLVADLAPAAQWQPSQMAVNDLQIRVPGVPEEAQAYEISLGEVRVLERERVPGGLRISLPDFGPTALVLVTTDRALVEWMEAQVARVRSLAIPMAIEQARLQLQWVAEVNGRLAADGHTTRDAADLLSKADLGVRSAEEALSRAASSYDDYGLAWSEARRVGRPLRILMYGHFQDAMEALKQAVTPPSERNPYKPGPNEPQPPKTLPTRIVTPISCPPSLAFNTLPRHFLWVDMIAGGTFGSNLLPSGSFEDPSALKREGWVDEGYATDDVVGKIMTWDGQTSGRRGQVLRLTVEPEDKTQLDRLAPFLDHPAAAIRTPPVPVGGKHLFRISVWVKMVRPVPPGGGGLIIRDSLGGEPLQFRTSGAIPAWNQVILYRRSPAEGALTVSIGLAGFGEVLVDDLRIEPAESLGSEPFAWTRDDDKATRPNVLQPATPTARNLFPFRIAR